MDGVTMSGGHPIKPVAAPPTQPAAQPQWCQARIFPSWSNRWMTCGSALRPGGHCWQYGHPNARSNEESPMSNPESGITAAEQFNDEANARTEQLAREHQARGQRWLHEVTMARFEHHPPTGANVVQAHEQARVLGKGFAQWLLMFLPDCDERDKAMDALDLAVMHTNAAIARTQLKGAWHTGTLPEPGKS